MGGLGELMTPRKQELQPATMNATEKSATQIKDGVIRKMLGWGNLEENGKDIPPSQFRGRPSTVILHLVAAQVLLALAEAVNQHFDHERPIGPYKRQQQFWG